MAELKELAGQIDTENYDLVIHGGTVVTHRDVRPADLGIRNGRIVAVLPPESATSAYEFLNAKGKYVLPGMIDSHVHFRTPGMTNKETWQHGSRAAVSGGITTVMDMPNTEPPMFTPADAHFKHGIISGGSLVDFRFHAGVDPRNVGGVGAFAPEEANSAKAFLTSHHTASHVLRDRESLEELFRVSAERDLRLLFHAEHDAIFSMLDRWHGEPREYRDYEAHRPRSGAIVAVAGLIELVRRYGVSAHIVHVSSKEEVDMLSAAAAEGLPITFEVTTHHLSFTANDTERCGARIRLSPAIRDKADQDRLWSAVINGEAMTVGSDHAPHPEECKMLLPHEAPPGLPGTQELFHALFNGLRSRLPEHDTEDLLRICSRVLSDGPARKFGLLGRKGRIAAGYDADLVIFDPSHRWSLNHSSIQSLCGWSAYQGWIFTGVVERTIRRGETVFERTAEGEMRFGEPNGTWLPLGRYENSTPSKTNDDQEESIREAPTGSSEKILPPASSTDKEILEQSHPPINGKRLAKEFR
ncbi:dihydroorotase [Actinopolyspora xinjiangensis]|uniref:Dihydroorotase n=1 Tax=Actinopolyspora xinjiangensis TaxID=405564 RepID=A0A1H0WXX9_9ACTN|nr:dihydroorotase family protein [Actinopolyspora xinjiangensis]SDP95285.1 dihydroorotase [Actinopolyspora xinjiangensis]